MKKVHTIRGKMLTAIITIFTVIVIAFSVISGISMYRTTNNSLSTTMTEIAELAAANVSVHMQRFHTLLSEMADSYELQNAWVSEEDKLAFMDKKNREYHDIYGSDFFYADKDGKVLGLGLDIRDREFYQKGIAGETYLSDPIIRKDTGELGYTYVVPVEREKEVIGIIYMIIDYDTMYQLIKEININGKGDAYLVNSSGTTVVYGDLQTVIDGYNTAEEAKSDSGLKALADIERSALRGEIDFGEYSYEGRKSFAAYGPVSDTNGWAVIVTAPKFDFVKDTYIAVGLTIALSIVMAGIGALVLSRISNGISRPVKVMTDRMLLLAKGDLDSAVEECKSGDEIEILNQAMNETIQTLRAYVKNIDEVTSKIAAGDLTVRVDMDYIGNFSKIKGSLEQIGQKLSKSLLHISQGASEVKEEAGQMSDTAQVLADGTSEQAGAVEELLATVEDVKNDMKASAGDAKRAADAMHEIGNRSQAGNEQMKMLIQAMEKISSSSGEIGNIINTIEEIASQTNLLSLNASIEAARAGDAGKGFAVVAGEIGKLAGQSAKAVSSTRELIETAMREVQEGSRITDKTAEILIQTADGILETAKIVERTSNSCLSQAGMMEEINGGIEQISNVVGSNAEMAEKSSQISRELSQQSEVLAELVGEFQLKE